MVGGSLLLMQLSQAVSAYGENLIVYQLGSAADVEMYYKGLVVYLFPSVIFNQYLVAVLGPLVRDNEEKVNGLIRRYAWIAGIALVAVAWPTLIFGGLILERLFFEGSSTPLVLAALFALTGCVRLYYVLPSSYVGILAKRRQLFFASIGYMASALMLPLLSLGIFTLGFDVVVAVALASLFNWAFRSLIGTNTIWVRMRRQSMDSH